MDLTQVKTRLRELGIYPNKKLGQNFLINAKVIARVCEQVARLQPQAVVEVGPGLGALSESLHGLPAPLTLIELDRTLAAYWSERGFKVISGDALRISWDELGLPERSCLVSNLPYQISSSLVIERSLGPAAISDMVLMFQKEVAQRLQSRTRAKSYGLLSVIAQSFWTMETLIDVAPGAFHPPPQVESRVLVFRRKPQSESVVIDKTGYLEFVKAAFAMRRKQVGKIIFAYALSKWNHPAERSAKLLSELGIQPSQRAEEIEVPRWQALYQQLSRR